jgi:hypothetical protein
MIESPEPCGPVDVRVVLMIDGPQLAVNPFSPSALLYSPVTGPALTIQPRRTPKHTKVPVISS